MNNQTDKRHHLNSFLMRESLIDKQVMASTETETPVVRMLPETHVIKIGSSSIIDKGKALTYPVVEVLGDLLKTEKLILGVGGGMRSKHVFFYRL
ncbi:hypothetical protein [Methylocucumis oryzae]|uniref:hypothetical protein n=1 Tax=Methylocucumis oryzae TaxID=1632867 RepID=UPI001955393E|nr:hypothetical protein [Methylocucumis oryzae]